MNNNGLASTNEYTNLTDCTLKVLTMAVCVIIALSLSACSMPSIPAIKSAPSIDGGYLNASNDQVIYMQIAPLSGSSSNYLQINENKFSVMRGGNGFTWCMVTGSRTYSSTASLSDSNITIDNFTWLGNGGPTTAGAFDGSSITFTLPDLNGTLGPIVFQKASIDDYNTAVNQLRSECTQ